jgi:hypothetical protein
MSAGFLQRFYSAFPGGTMQQLLGNGTITEAGGVLTVTTPASVDCDWWGSSPANAPIAYQSVHDRITAFDGVLKFEARCYQFSALANTEMWAVVWVDRSTAYLLCYGNGSLYVNRFYGGSNSTVTSSTAVASPTTSPHTYRIYWNPTSRPLFIQESDGTNFVINANEIQFWYRIGDGGTWTQKYARSMEFTNALRFGVGCKNWSTFPANSSLWSYAGIYQWDATAQKFVPSKKDVQLTNTQADPLEVLALEDRAVRLTESGYPAFDSPDGLGGPVVLEGEQSQSRVAFEDSAQILDAGGQRLGFMPDVMGGGLSLDDVLALEDAVTYYLSPDAEFSTITQDTDLHYHFTQPKPYIAVPYDTTGEAWANPTTTGFTGYARNGYRYTNGVQDAGPVSAPWRTEASGSNRSSRGDFPVRALIVATRLELVIFDMDSFNGTPSTLRMWMRFLLGNSSSDFYALGRGLDTIRSVSMANGLLAVGTQDTGWEPGRLHTIDFRANTPATTFSLVGNDGQWIGQGTKTIVDRNTNTIWLSSGSYRITLSQLHSLSMLVEGTSTHIAISGEDPTPNVVSFSGNTVSAVAVAAGADIGSSNAGDTRQVYFDDVGWLWFSIGSRLYRNCHDWRHGYIWPDKSDLRQGTVDIGYTITKIVAAKNNVYCATEKGVFSVSKGSLSNYLAYTIVGGGGGGRLNAPPAGEILVGTAPVISALRSYTLLQGITVVPYLVVGTLYSGGGDGGFTLIRMFDDVVIKSLIVPNLIEPGTYIATVMMA